MARMDTGHGWAIIKSQVLEAKQSKYPLKGFASIRDRLLKEDCDAIGRLRTFCDILKQQGYKVEHLQGAQWQQLWIRTQIVDRRTGRPIAAVKKLSQLRDIRARWPRRVLRLHGWDVVGETQTALLHKCAMRLPDYERHFLPVANFVLLLRHRAALRVDPYDVKIGILNQKMTMDALRTIITLVYSPGPVQLYGETYTLREALESHELIQTWMTSQDESLSIGPNMQKRIQNRWLVVKGSNGLIRAKPKLV